MDKELGDILCDKILEILEKSDEMKKQSNEQRASILWQVILLLEKKMENSRKIKALYFFVLTGKKLDEYPDGEMPSVEDLSDFRDDPYTALDLLRKMIYYDDLSVKEVLDHPFHWKVKDKIEFICEAHLLIGRDQRRKEMHVIDNDKEDVSSYRDWVTTLNLSSEEIETICQREDRGMEVYIRESIIRDLASKYKNYENDSISGLMHFFRNNHAYFAQLDSPVKLVFGDRETGYWKFYNRRFPKLFLHVFRKMAPEMRFLGSPAVLTADSANIILKISSEIQALQLPLNYVKGDILGRGAFGKVYLAYCGRKERETCAVKILEFESLTDTDRLKELQELQKEIDLMKHLSHKRIVGYIDSTKDSKALYIFMEYMKGGSLKQEITKNGPLKEEVACKYTRQIVEGLAYLHSNTIKIILHRDIKCANVLQDGSGNVKLADFGVSKELQTVSSASGHTKGAGTDHWMSPEVFNGEKYGPRADIWSVGITALEMVTKNLPWFNLGYTDLKSRFSSTGEKKGPELPSNISQKMREFLDIIFVERAKRKSAEKLLSHCWLMEQKEEENQMTE